MQTYKLYITYIHFHISGQQKNSQNPKIKLFEGWAQRWGTQGAQCLTLPECTTTRGLGSPLKFRTDKNGKN